MKAEVMYAATKVKLYIYSLDGMEIIAKLETQIHLGWIALSPSISNPFILYTKTIMRGNLTVFDYFKITVQSFLLTIAVTGVTFLTL